MGWNQLIISQWKSKINIYQSDRDTFVNFFVFDLHLFLFWAQNSLLDNQLYLKKLQSSYEWKIKKLHHMSSVELSFLVPVIKLSAYVPLNPYYLET